MAYAVLRRTRETGVRIALGAASSQVLRVVLNRVAVLVGLGTAVGLTVALACGKFFGQILYCVSPHDPLPYVCALALMAAMAFVAYWVPARRAIRVDPLTALPMECDNPKSASAIDASGSPTRKVCERIRSACSAEEAPWFNWR